MSNKWKKWAFDLLKLLICIFLCVIMLFPFIWMVSTSFKYSWEVVAFPPRILPQEFAGFEAYRTVFQEIPFATFLKNSGLVAIAVTITTLFTSSLAGYVFAKFNFIGKQYYFMAILATMMIPFDVICIPLYLLIRQIGLLNNLFALILPGMVSAYGIFLCRQFIRGIPDSLVDASRIDGCSEFGIYFTIILPLSLPVLSALGIFTFMANWDSFLWPLIVLDDVSKKTLPLGLSLFRQTFGMARWNVIMAGAVISILPIMIVFLLAQKNFIEGITLSGMKM